eukprot:superscaffoldBa00006949_g22063
MPTCLLCVCIGGSVYCDDAGLDQIPPLPKDTTHFYGRFNKIRHLKNTDFINLSGESVWRLRSTVKSQIKTNIQIMADIDYVFVCFTDKLQSIDLTGNQISEMDEDAFRSLLHLQQLLLADNNLQMIPELPITMKRIDLRNNRLISQGMHTEVFKVDPLLLCLDF